MELYDYTGGAVSGMLEDIDAAEILKAMEAGLKTGMQYDNQISNGGGLKVESLDSVLKVLGNRLNQLVVLNEMPKHKIDNTVHQYNQLYKYGEEVGIFNMEGETPEETDSQYIRKSVITKFMGVTVAHHLRNTPNVIGFLGGSEKPVPLRQSEVNRILGTVDELQDAGEELNIPYVVGETVKVNYGPFSGFSGIIEEVNTEKKKLKVMVKIFGRKTPLELGFMQVEKE